VVIQNACINGTPHNLICQKNSLDEKKADTQ
jgi:hypothetical protein